VQYYNALLKCSHAQWRIILRGLQTHKLLLLYALQTLQELSSASTRLLYDLLRDPVLAQSDIKHKNMALGFAKLTQWTAMTNEESDDTYNPMIARFRNLQDSNLRYFRVRAIERYGSSALYIYNDIYYCYSALHLTCHKILLCTTLTLCAIHWYCTG
jgi:hypothetical protein